jgi:hypothetical protein
MGIKKLKPVCLPRIPGIRMSDDLCVELQFFSKKAACARRIQPKVLCSNPDVEDRTQPPCRTLFPDQLEVGRHYLLCSTAEEFGLGVHGEKMLLEKIEYNSFTPLPSMYRFSFSRASFLPRAKVDYCVFLNERGNRFLFTGRQLEKQINIYLVEMN